MPVGVCFGPKTPVYRKPFSPTRSDDSRNTGTHSVYWKHSKWNGKRFTLVIDQGYDSSVLDHTVLEWCVIPEPEKVERTGGGRKVRDLRVCARRVQVRESSTIVIWNLWLLDNDYPKNTHSSLSVTLLSSRSHGVSRTTLKLCLCLEFS